MEQNNQLIFDLIKLGILDCNLQTIQSQIPLNMFKSIYDISKAHNVSHLLYAALKKNDLFLTANKAETEQYIQSCRQDYLYSAYKCVQIDKEKFEISKVLNNLGIKHVFLKGAVLRNIYPQIWMRTSGDLDCLVPEERLFDAVEALKKSGYNTDGQKHYHDIELDKPSIHLELHFNIQENNTFLDNVLKTVWNNVEQVSDFEYVESSDFFVFHHIAHMAYHITTGGCGIRPFVDLWVMKNRFPYNEDAVHEMCKTAHINDFFVLANRMVGIWFENESHDQDTLKFERFILNSATFGTIESKQNLSEYKKSKTKKNIISHLFLPYEQMKEAYPILNKHKILLPYYEMYRLVKKSFDREQRAYLTSVLNTTDKNLDADVKEVLRVSGLANIIQ